MGQRFKLEYTGATRQSQSGGEVTLAGRKLLATR